MRHFGRRPSRRFTKRQSRPRVQHSPASMAQSLNADLGLLVVLGKANEMAGTALATDRDAGDRQQDLQTGNIMGNTTVTITGDATTTSHGHLGVVFYRLPRSFTVPVIGTDPIPSDADCVSGGMQASYRKNLPGYIIKYLMFPYSAETPFTRIISLNWAKFRMAKIRDGDFFVMNLHNFGTGQINFNWEARYYEYK